MNLNFSVVPLIFLTSLAWYICYTLAWQVTLGAFNLKQSFIKLFRIKLAGEAANNLHAASFVSGDMLRIELLNKSGEDNNYDLSVVIDRTIHSLASATLIFIAIIICFIDFRSQPSNIRYGVPIATLVILIFGIFASIHQRKGVFGIFFKICRRVGLGKNFSDKMVERFEKLDSHIIDFCNENPSKFFRSFCLHFSGRMLTLLEIFLIERFLNIDLSFTFALMLSAIVPLINAMFSFIPGAMVIMEAAFAMSGWAFGIGAYNGLLIQLARRMRSLCWMVVGVWVKCRGRPLCRP